jgi:hypothetical protein
LRRQFRIAIGFFWIIFIAFGFGLAIGPAWELSLLASWVYGRSVDEAALVFSFNESTLF